jgi:AcrR family transcriptional regulator
MKKRQNQDKEKRQDILLAAEIVFAERGFKGTTVREVAKRANIHNSLIFYYFKNKSVLYEAVFESFFEQMEDLVQYSMNLDMDRLGIFKKIVFGVIGFSATHRNLMIILVRELMENGRVAQKTSQEYFKPVYDTIAEFLAEGGREAIFRDVDPVHFVQSIVAMVVFYFINEPFIRAMGLRNPYGSREIEKRKNEVWKQIRSILT